MRNRPVISGDRKQVVELVVGWQWACPKKARRRRRAVFMMSAGGLSVVLGVLDVLGERGVLGTQLWKHWL